MPILGVEHEMTIAIVEDNPLAASILKEYVEGDGLSVTGLYGSGEDLLSALPGLPLPDIILMDIGLPGISGIETTRRIKAAHPSVSVIVQSVFEDKETIMEAVKAGASGYLIKASSRTELRAAIEEIRSGGSPLSGKIAKTILDECRSRGCTDAEAASRFSLTEREASILSFLVRGESCKCIAAELGISIHTVNNHLRSVYEKMRVNSRSEAVARALGL